MVAGPEYLWNGEERGPLPGREAAPAVREGHRRAGVIAAVGVNYCTLFDGPKPPKNRRGHSGQTGVGPWRQR